MASTARSAEVLRAILHQGAAKRCSPLHILALADPSTKTIRHSAATTRAALAPVGSLEPRFAETSSRPRSTAELEM